MSRRKGKVYTAAMLFSFLFIFFILFFSSTRIYMQSSAMTVRDVGTSPSAIKIPTGPNPASMVYDVDEEQIFVADGGGCEVSAIAVTTESNVGNIPVGCSPQGPDAIVYDSTNEFVYVASEFNAQDNGPGLVTIIDGESDRVFGDYTCSCFGNPNSIVQIPSNGELVVTDSQNSRIYVLSTDIQIPVAYFNTKASILLGEAYDPSNGLVYMADSIDNEVWTFNPDTNATSIITGVGGSPVNVAYDPNNGNMYTTNAISDTVSVISSSTNKVVATIDVGDDPQGAITYDPVNHYMYVGNLDSKSVSIIGNDTFIATLKVGPGPLGLVFSSLKNKIYVAHWSEDDLTLFPATKT